MGTCASASVEPLRVDGPGRAYAAQAKQIGVLDEWPDGTLYEAWPQSAEPSDIATLYKGRAVSTRQLFANKRTVLIGLHGAFGPTCHRQHVPPYIDRAQDFIDAGVDQIIGLTTNDVFCTRCV